MNVQDLPLTKLHRAEWNANRVDDETLGKVKRSVEQYGLVENLVVRKHPEHKAAFEVLSGNHRRDIYEQLGMETAPCVVVDVDDAHARLLAQTLNRTRGEDDPLAYRELLESVLEDLPVSAVTDLLPESTQSIARILDAYGDAEQELEIKEVWGVIVELEDESGQVELLARLEEEGYKCRALMS